MKITIAAEVTGPEFAYKEAHEWDWLSADGGDYILAELSLMADYAQRLAERGKGDLRGVLSMAVDGVGQPDVVIPNLSYADLVKFERQFGRCEDDINQYFADKRKRGHH